MEYWLLRNDEKHGPYSQEQLGEFAKQGNLSSSDRLWHHGLEDWEAPLSVLPSLELFDSDQRATEVPIPGARLGSQQRQPKPEARTEALRQRSFFLRSGLRWIPVFSALLVGALGFQPFVRAVVGPGLSEALLETGWFDPEETEALAVGGASMFVGHLYQEEPLFGVLSWCVGILVGAVNGLSFGAILGWLASLIGSRDSLRTKFVIFSALGGAIGLILSSIIGDRALVLLVGFLGWREGLLLGACFAVVHTLDELRVGAVSSHLEDGD